MVLGWRRRKNNAHKKNLKVIMDLEIPNHFLCPISLDLMKDPVTLSSGITYDRENIETWLEAGNFTCPVTKQILQSFDLIPNHSLRKLIQEWCMENQKYGVQRIPTPKTPVLPLEVSEILFSVEASVRRKDMFGCLESVKIIQKWGAESERNRRCIMVNGAANVLANALDSFATSGSDMSGFEEILSALNWMFPFGEEARKYLGSEASLRCLVSFLQHDDLSVKQNSAMVLTELLSYGDKRHLEVIANIEGLVLILMDFIRKQICPKITKASLMLIFHLVSSSNYTSSETIKSAFVEMGLVSLILGILVDSGKGVITENALGVMDGICGYEKGRKEAFGNALTIPVLVKKLLRVSDVATAFSISAIYKLCKNVNEEDDVHGRSVLVEALQVGAFQKLLLIIQVSCCEETKKKATELLKLLNPYRPQLECIESADFKSLRSSF